VIFVEILYKMKNDLFKIIRTDNQLLFFEKWLTALPEEGRLGTEIRYFLFILSEN
jgi:hypothetical protein